jgi:hypothetical protein
MTGQAPSVQTNDGGDDSARVRAGNQTMVGSLGAVCPTSSYPPPVTARISKRCCSPPWEMGPS